VGARQREAHRDPVSRWLNSVEKVVFSTTLTVADRLSITLCRDDPDASWRLTDSTPAESGALCLLYDRA
jgi:hypothetical protein